MRTTQRLPGRNCSERYINYTALYKLHLLHLLLLYHVSKPLMHKLSIINPFVFLHKYDSFSFKCVKLNA